jgi:glycosyltransferase involved in cell wall biosynthesis
VQKIIHLHDISKEFRYGEPLCTTELLRPPENPVQDTAMACRILYLVGQLAAGGLERQLCYLLQALDRPRYRPAVAVWNFREAEVYVAKLRKLNVPIYPLPRGSAYAKLMAFRQLVRELQPEVVHSYTFFTNFAAYWGCRQTRSLAVGSIRCDFAFEMRDSNPFFARLSARWPRDQISNSYVAFEAVHRTQSPFVPRRLIVVHNGLDLENFHSVPPLRPNAGNRIVGVGTLEPRKRWDRLLIAGEKLQRLGHDFTVQIVGEGPSSALLQDQARALGVADRFQFLGYQENVQDILAGASFLVHTSDNEGYPNVIMEAMACGRAVVATDAGDVSLLVEDGKTGFVVPREDNALLVTRMATLMTDRELCRQMGEAGRVKAKQNFGLDRLTSQTFDAYRSLGWKGA